MTHAGIKWRRGIDAPSPASSNITCEAEYSHAKWISRTKRVQPCQRVAFYQVLDKFSPSVLFRIPVLDTMATMAILGTRPAVGSRTRPSMPRKARRGVVKAKADILEQVQDQLNQLDLNDSATLATAVLALGVPTVTAGITFYALSEAEGKRVRKANPAQAYNLVAERGEAPLIDARDRATARQEGNPDVGRSRVPVPLEPEGTFPNRAGRRAANSAKVVVMGKNNTEARTAASLLSSEMGLECLFVSSDEWKASGQPWREPGEGLAGALTKAAQNPNTVQGALTAGAVIGAGAFLTSEADAILELVGTAGAANLLIRRFLFYEDRKRTIEELRKFFDERIAPNELISDLKLVYQSATGETESGREALSTSSPSSEPSSSPSSPSEDDPVAMQAKEAQDWINNWKRNIAGKASS